MTWWSDLTAFPRRLFQSKGEVNVINNSKLCCVFTVELSFMCCRWGCGCSIRAATFSHFFQYCNDKIIRKRITWSMHPCFLGILNCVQPSIYFSFLLLCLLFTATVISALWWTLLWKAGLLGFVPVRDLIWLISCFLFMSAMKTAMNSLSTQRKIRQTGKEKGF